MAFSRLVFGSDSDLLYELRNDPALSPTARLALRDLSLAVSLMPGVDGLVLFVCCPARSLGLVLRLAPVLKAAVEADDYLVWATDEY